jgi:hypothetical protein
MIRSVSGSLAFTLLAFLGTGTVLGGAPEEDGWDKIKNLLFSEALTLFRDQQKQGEQSLDSVRLGEAVALLHRQPTTRANTENVLSILEVLISQSEDEGIALQAAYLKARIVQLHPFEPNPDAAIPLYLDLARKYPETILGQFAFVKASGLQLYDPDTPDDGRPFEAISNQSAFLSDPDVIRSYNLLVAEASQRLDYSDTFSLGHYIEAYDAGLTKPDLRANVLARIIVLSQRLGDIGTTRARAEEFRTEFPRDIRITMVEELLEEMP